MKPMLRVVAPLLIGCLVFIIFSQLFGCGPPKKKEIINIPEQPEVQPDSSKKLSEQKKIKPRETGDLPLLQDVLIRASRHIASLHLKYSRQPADFRDCSGIFHRVISRIRSECVNIVGPDRKTNRSSRSIARWFIEHGQFKPVRNAIDQEDLIRPGTIMFYGKNGRKYRNMTSKKATLETEHIGIVTSAVRDKRGKVVKYTLFHGRSGKKIAKETLHFRKYPYSANYPSFGNGRQQWIGAAWLCSREVCRCEGKTVRWENGILVAKNEAIGDDKRIATDAFREHPEKPPQLVTRNSQIKQTGLASWYGKKFDGRPTASGEPFDSRKLTGAHKTIPFQTLVKVTNLENGKSVVVRINDRGPHSKKRIIDISEEAARRIGMLSSGSVRVRIETVAK